MVILTFKWTGYPGIEITDRQKLALRWNLMVILIQRSLILSF